VSGRSACRALATATLILAWIWAAGATAAEMMEAVAGMDAREIVRRTLGFAGPARLVRTFGNSRLSGAPPGQDLGLPPGRSL
jgi:hypothetical protein